MNTVFGYEDLQARLRWLVTQMGDQLPRTTVEFISEFIDANECGLALETLSEMFVEVDARINRQTFEAVALLTTEMGMDRENVDRLLPLLESGS